MTNKVIIIAEAGVNHNGDINIAKRLVDAAAEAGVDYIKFQTFKADALVSKEAKKADYQKENTKNSNESQYEMLKKLELSEEQHQELIEYCSLKNINFFSTAFDLKSLQYLKTIGLNIVKIPSGEITNLPYLRLASKLFEKIIISTGMCTMKEVKNAFDVFINNKIKKENITILHCTTEYPTPMNEVNLKAMLHIQKELGTQIGYSDHTLGIEVPIAAVALGAKVIEKHFTLDRLMNGPDHLASLEPNSLTEMVKSIRNIELAIEGTGIKNPSKSEIKNIEIARKSIHVSKTIKKGDIILEDDLIMMRPGNGISPMELDQVVGKKSKIELVKGKIINWGDIL